MARKGEVEREWIARGYTFDIFHDPPGQSWADFVHDVDEVLMLDEGEIELQVGNRTFKPERWEEIFVPAGTKHTVRNTGEVTSRWFYGYRSRGRGKTRSVS